MHTHRLFQRTGIAFAILAAGCTLMPDGEPPLETVEQVNLERYTGTWHEIARIPSGFESHCAGNVTAEYRLLKNGGIDVTNRCLTKRGSYDVSAGVARVVKNSGNAKLEVSFVQYFDWRPFWGDYWIIGLDPDYQWAVIGTPGRDYGWILSRDTQLDDATRHHIDELLRQHGYDPELFEDTRQGLSESRVHEN